MSTQTRTGSYLKRMANGGHYKQKLGEATLAVVECFCKADIPKSKQIGTDLVEQTYEVLTNVYGWEHDSAKSATRTLQEAFNRAEDMTP